jgi:toxin ParE1/3/4
MVAFAVQISDVDLSAAYRSWPTTAFCPSYRRDRCPVWAEGSSSHPRVEGESHVDSHSFWALTLHRLFDFSADHNPKARARANAQRPAALELLSDHPLLGREAEDGRRELILSRGKFGYVAKYRWVPAEDVALILAVRHQLEAGYKEE